MLPQIAPSQLDAWFASHQGSGVPVLLDVREPWELQTASVKPEGFELLHIPMQSVPERLAEIPRDRPVACMCHHGARSQRVALFLEQQGLPMLANVAGGIAAWSSERDSSVPQY